MTGASRSSRVTWLAPWCRTRGRPSGSAPSSRSTWRGGPEPGPSIEITDCPARSPASADRLEELVRGLDLGHVPGVLEHLEPGLRDGVRPGAAVLGGHDPVAVAPYHQGRDLHAPEAPQEGGG